ncbi:MAG: hypothetical protein ACI9LU_001994, partial [Polaribacter sp.]
MIIIGSTGSQSLALMVYLKGNFNCPFPFHQDYY